MAPQVKILALGLTVQMGSPEPTKSERELTPQSCPLTSTLALQFAHSCMYTHGHICAHTHNK